MSNRWLLPESIDEILPPDARRLELLRRSLLDLYHSWGYELVMPPLVEFLESLLTGTGNDLDLQTFKLIDQLSGRMLGVRADMTPQVARIDAHQLRLHDDPHHPNRLCYTGTVLHTRSDGFGSSRSPLQIGAELYGHSGIASDLEIIHLMLATLRTAGVEHIHLDLGHVGIFRSLARQANLDAERETTLFSLLQGKALPELTAQLDHYALPAPVADMLLALAELNGDASTLDLARAKLEAASDDVHQALDTLDQLRQTFASDNTGSTSSTNVPGPTLHFDLAELRGGHYHTGTVFAAYVPTRGQEIARGGRYDGIGLAFGQHRPATGFSTDLKLLLALSETETLSDPARTAIYAPAAIATGSDAGLETLITTLRAGGERVIRALHDHDSTSVAVALGCNRVLRKNAADSRWAIVPLHD